MKLEKSLLLTLAIIIIGMNLTGFATVEAADIQVPGDYGTISEAIDAASPGDTIMVAAGVYYENLYIDKIIRIGSVSGAASTIIDGSVDGNVVEINNTRARARAGGGVVYGRVKYDTDASFYTSYLHEVENATALAVEEYGWGNVAVLAISWSECADILSQAQYFPTTYNVPWFGCDGTVTYSIVDGAAEHADQVHLYSTYPAIPDSADYDSLNDRYITSTGSDLAYYGACTYDIAFIIADAVISTESTDPADVIPVIPAKALAREDGITGWCKLNAAGDRYASDYEIWGYGDTGYGTDMHQYGYYDAGTDTVTWDTELLGFDLWG